MKITPIIASQEIPAVRNIRVPLGAFTGQARGFAVLGAGLEQVSEDWYQVARYEQAIEQKQREFQNVTETLKLRGELKSRLADVAVELKATPPDKYDSIPKTFRQKMNLIKNELNTKALAISSDVYDLFQKESIGILGDAEIAAKRLRDEKFVHKTKADILTLKNQVENDAPTIRDPSQMIGFWNAFAQKAVNEGIIQPEEFVKLQDSLKENVSFNKIKMDAYADPLGTMERFSRGEYKDLSPDVQDKATKFLEARIRHFETEERKKEALVKKELEENEQGIKSALMTKIMEGENVSAIVHDLLATNSMDPERANSILAFQNSWIKKTGVEGVDDPETVRRLMPKLYGAKVGTTEREIIGLMDQGLLSQKTAQQYLNHLTGRVDKERRQAETDIDKEFSQASQYLKSQMRVVGWMEFDKASERLMGEAERELWSRKEKGEKPMQIIDDIIGRYRRGIADQGLMGADSIRQSLIYGNRRDGTVDDLLVALHANESKISPATFEAQLKLLNDLAELEKIAEMQKTQPVKSAPKKEKK